MQNQTPRLRVARNRNVNTRALFDKSW